MVDKTDADRTFYIFRYTVVEEVQAHLYTRPLPVPKGKVVAAALGVKGEDTHFYKNGVYYSFVGFKWAQPSKDFPFPPDRFLIGKLAKLRITEMGTHVPGDIVMERQEDWVGLVTIFDTKSQHVMVEKNWRFGNTEQTENALQAGLAAIVLELYNCNVFVKPRTTEHFFWHIVNESASIYALDLKLISPNLLDANKKARKALEDLKSIFKQDEIDISLKSESGSLSLPEAPVADYINYIAEGEGSWKLVTKKGGGRKRVHSSLQNVQTMEVPVPEQSVVNNAEGGDIAKNDVLLMVSAAFTALENMFRE